MGVNRDTIGFGLGAKPVANTYGFCFGEPDDTRLLFRDKESDQSIDKTRLRELVEAAQACYKYAVGYRQRCAKSEFEEKLKKLHRA